MDICIRRGLVVLFLNTPKKKKNTSEQKTTKRCTAIQDKKKIEWHVNVYAWVYTNGLFSLTDLTYITVKKKEYSYILYTKEKKK
jgi:hypothetical protein